MLLVLGSQGLKRQAFPSQWAGISAVMEHGRRLWSGPRAPFSSYSTGRKGSGSLPVKEAKMGEHQGTSGVLWRSTSLCGALHSLRNFFCCVFPLVVLPVPGQPLAHEPSHSSQKIQQFISLLDHGSGLHVWQRSV